MASSSGQPGPTGTSSADGEPLLESDKRERRKAAALRSLQTDVGRGVVYNVRLSKFYVAYCLIMALLTTSLVIFMIIHVETAKSPIPLWVVIVDCIITFVMIAETVADMILLGWSFWESGWHAFDFGVALISLACWIFILLDYLTLTKSFDEFLTILLLSIRYTAQAFRIVRYLRSAADATSVQQAVEEHEIRMDMESTKPAGLQQHLGSLRSIGSGWDARNEVSLGADRLEDGDFVEQDSSRRDML